MFKVNAAGKVIEMGTQIELTEEDRFEILRCFSEFDPSDYNCFKVDGKWSVGESKQSIKGTR